MEALAGEIRGSYLECDLSFPSASLDELSSSVTLTLAGAGNSIISLLRRDMSRREML